MVQNSIIRDQILQYFDIHGIEDILIDLLFLMDDIKKENITYDEKIKKIYQTPNKTLNLYRFNRHVLFSYLNKFQENEFYQKINNCDDERITINNILNNNISYILKYFDIDSINDLPIFLLSLTSDCKRKCSIWTDEINDLYKDNAVGAYINLVLMELILYLEHTFNITIHDEEACEIITLRDLINKVQEKLSIKNQ